MGGADTGMNALIGFLQRSDAISGAVAALLLAMSIGAWVLILWKSWLLARVRADLARAVPAFWAAETYAEGTDRLRALDRERVLLPLADAAAEADGAPSLGAQGDTAARLTRRLRTALHAAVRPLQFGQVALASIGSTAPFIGLFGTVWGIEHALAAMAAGGAMTVDRVAGPVGEALVMTAAGLAVAIPAVLAYNILGKQAGACEAELEGYAHDLRELLGASDVGSGHAHMAVTATTSAATATRT